MFSNLCFITGHLEGNPHFVAPRETKQSIISANFPHQIKSGPPCVLHVFLLNSLSCLVISHHHSHFLSFKSSLPPRLILNLTSFICEALVHFLYKRFPSPSVPKLTQHIRSKNVPCREAHTQGKGRGQKNSHALLSVSTSQNKVPLLAVCG